MFSLSALFNSALLHPVLDFRLLLFGSFFMFDYLSIALRVLTNLHLIAGGNGRKDNCRTPDSPESARAVAPRSPISPQIHLTNSLAPPPRPNRNASSSPVVNGANTTPPPSHQTAAQIEQSRLLGKLRKFLGSLVQFSQEVHPDVSDRIRALVLSLAVSLPFLAYYIRR